jgi:hypothetical protein
MAPISRTFMSGLHRQHTEGLARSMIRFEHSGPHLKAVPFCDHDGCTRFGPFGINSNLRAALDRKDAKLAGTHFCRDHLKTERIEE